VGNGIDQYEIGEIAVLVYSYCYPELAGVEVEIIGGLELRYRWLDNNSTVFSKDIAYRIDVPGGPKLAVTPDQLRKKPPRGDLRAVPWSRCAWNPEAVEA
jgi:hypothetical protein